MKKLLFKIVLLFVVVQNSFGQYHEFSKASAFIVSPGATITHIARAGGGVVLKGVTKPKHPDSLAVFTNVTFDEAKGLSTMFIQTKGANIFYSDSSWLMRDAAMLVKSERADVLYRDVNILGDFTYAEIDSNYYYKYSSDNFFNVEMANSLVNTKSGQTLLYMDIMLSSDKNTKYYCDNKAYKKYKFSNDSLLKVINNYNDSVIRLWYRSINETYLKLKNLDSLTKIGKLDDNEIKLLNKIKQYSIYNLFESQMGYEFSFYDDTVSSYEIEIVSLFNPNYNKSTELKYPWHNYTYNDEYANYAFYINNEKRLILDGEPNYTFLYKKLNSVDLEIDTLFTNYYITHSDLIRNLNYTVVKNAESFGKIAAFFRYLKKEYPKLWSQVYTHYSHISKTDGETPRFINKFPSNE